MIKKTLIYSLLLTIFSSANAEGNISKNFETKAKIEKFCSIQTNDVAFGVVALPLTAQAANSQMRVLCTKNTPYKIDLNYGQYVPSENSNQYTINYVSSNNEYNYYVVSNSSGSISGALLCGYAGSFLGKASPNKIEIAKIFGSSTLWQQPNTGICTSDNTKEGTKPAGWEGAYNKTGTQPAGGIKKSEFGFMSGAQKGDKLAYSFTLPEDSSKAWSKGFNSYDSTGVGIEQIINVNAKIVPNKSSSKYIAADIYMDSITAEIIY